jgi:glc operon protein GlcG
MQMKKLLVIATLLVLCESTVLAQNQPATPANSPGGALVTRGLARLNLGGAEVAIAGARQQAGAMKLKVNIAVVDEGGHLLAFARMDGARPASSYTAITKATSSALLRAPTGPLPAGTTTPDVLVNLGVQNAAAASGGKFTTLFGGVPIVVEGQVVGAVGVGGASGEQDAEIARAGVEAFVKALTEQTK